MEKPRKRKKECSAKGCRKVAVDGGRCHLHAVVKDEAVAERVVTGQRIKSTANKISRLRKANEPEETAPETPVPESHSKSSKSHVVSHKKYGFSAICFKAGKAVGKFGAYLEGK